MSEYFSWRKMKKKDVPAVEMFLRAIEKKYVSACGRFLSRDLSKDPVWFLRGRKGEIAGLIVNFGSTLIPVLCEKKEIPVPKFLKRFFNKKKIHSVQGLKEEVIFIQQALDKKSGKIAEIIDYELMDIDKCPQKEGFSSGPSNLILRVPSLVDVDALAPLQAGYEREEVIPKGSTFSPASSRVNITNIISSGQILAAEISGRLVGKINVSYASFTRYLIGGVYVHPDFRSLGIARRMTTEFTASLIGEGKGVTLFVKKSNLAARRLYTGIGFSVKDDYRITYY